MDVDVSLKNRSKNNTKQNEQQKEMEKTTSKKKNNPLNTVHITYKIQNTLPQSDRNCSCEKALHVFSLS